jgi:hypothetical protein
LAQEADTSLNSGAWKKFVKAREHFRYITEETERSVPQLKKIQQKFADSRAGKNSSYTVETPVVYNCALDDITAGDEIKLILVADNPGRREQAAENRRYLVGPSGKIAQKFFRDNPQLGIDFTKNVIILNKTPIHSPRTAELRRLCLPETGSNSIAAVIKESQIKMAQLLLEFHEALCVPVYIIGYSEMKKGGIFEIYTETLKKIYTDKKYLYDQIFLFRHFSMNQFTIDLKKQALKGETVNKSLARIGASYKNKIINLTVNL